MLSKWCRTVVMSPEKLLELTSRYVRFEFLQITSGILPESKLEVSERLTRLPQLPSSEGFLQSRYYSQVTASWGYASSQALGSKASRSVALERRRLRRQGDVLHLVQVMPPHKHGDASEASHFSSRGDMTVKAFLNSIKAKPSGVRATTMPTTQVSKVTRAKFHLGICVL